MVRPKAQFKGDGAWVKPPDFSPELRQALREFRPLELEKEEFFDHILAEASWAIGALQHCEGDVLKGEMDLTRFCGHFSVTQRGIQDVEIKTEIHARV